MSTGALLDMPGEERLNILMITPQLPYPLKWGFAVRVFQLARGLHARHDVTLLAAARRDERESIEALRTILRVHAVEKIEPPTALKRAKQLRSLVSARPFSVHAVCPSEMQRAVWTLCAEERFDIVQIESSLLWALEFPDDVPVVVDEHNIEYELLQRMAQNERSVPRRAFNRIECRRFRRFEEDCWRRVDGCVVTSEREAPVIADAAPGTPTVVVPNGVDLEYFRPSTAPVDPRTVVFNGTLRYRPNVDAAHHLVEEIWPLVVAQRPGARLDIVGQVSDAQARRLRRPGVVVTGEVPDVRPYLERAAVVAVPVRIGGGTRLKVIEALATGKAIVSTRLGCEGVAVRDTEHLLMADDAQSFADRIVELFDDPAAGQALGYAGRRLTEAEYSWTQATGTLEDLYRCVRKTARETTVEGVKASEFVIDDRPGRAGAELRQQVL